MAKKKKRPTRERVIEPTPRTVQIQLSNIAKKLGTTVPELLESYGDAQTIIEKFDSGDLALLTE